MARSDYVFPSTHVFFLLCFAVLSLAAFLSAQDRFTRIGTGDIVNDAGISPGFSWGDFNNDGYNDLFVPNWQNQNNFLYQNNQDGTFTKIRTGPVVNDRGYSSGGCWGDYDNDGNLDLFVANQRNQNNCLYKNDGNGAFIKMTNGDVVNDYGDSYAAAWGDFDNDGFLDLFVANAGQPSFLYRNNGNGTFQRIKDSAMTSDVVIAWNVSWGDYNNDGHLDLFVADGFRHKNLLYKNRGDGTFEKITDDPVVNDIGYSKGGSWGDYDNDGDIDLFVANGGNSLDGQNDFLYRNNGNGTFTKVEEGEIVNSGGYSHGGAWGDFDNDGDLDLFVGIWGFFDRLYLNNGDGTFSRETVGAAVNQIGFVSGNVPGCDYDNDGDLDLFLPNWENQNNILFRNNTRGNHWIRIACRGVSSNRFGIGAKVWVRAFLNGNTVMQLREITTNIGCRSQGSMDASFGLADAEIIEYLKIEWPSGKVDEIKKVKADQIITIEEGRGIVHQMKPDKPVDKQSIFSVLNQVISEKGINAAVNEYYALKQKKYEEYDFGENQLNYLGYQLLKGGKLDEAIIIFKMNIEAFPESANGYDSMAEAYAAGGDQKQAINYYKKVLEVLAEDKKIDENTKENLMNNAKYNLKNLER